MAVPFTCLFFIFLINILSNINIVFHNLLLSFKLYYCFIIYTIFIILCLLTNYLFCCYFAQGITYDFITFLNSSTISFCTLSFFKLFKNSSSSLQLKLSLSRLFKNSPTLSNFILYPHSVYIPSPQSCI